MKQFSHALMATFGGHKGPCRQLLDFHCSVCLSFKSQLQKSHQSHFEVAASTADSSKVFHALSFSTSLSEKYLWGMYLQRFGYLTLELKFIFTTTTCNRVSTLGKNTSIALRRAKAPEKIGKCRGCPDRLLKMRSLQSVTNSWWNKMLVRYQQQNCSFAFEKIWSSADSAAESAFVELVVCSSSLLSQSCEGSHPSKQHQH